MTRKQMSDGGKRNAVIQAALQLFPENGCDGTTIIMIQQNVYSEVGLFYYCFKNKHGFFDTAVDTKQQGKSRALYSLSV